jgi:hypothetical protein
MKFSQFLREARGPFHSDKVGDIIRYKGHPYFIRKNSFTNDAAKVMKQLDDAGYERKELAYTKKFKEVPNSGHVLVLDGEDQIYFFYPDTTDASRKSKNTKDLGFDAGKVNPTKNLKPQDFGLEDQEWWTINEYVDHLRKRIKERKELDDVKADDDDEIEESGLRAYLLDLIEYFTTKNEDVARRLASYKEIKLPTNEIKKDFGEIIGPIALTNKTGGFFTGFEFDDQSLVHFPKSKTNALIDYVLKKVDENGEEILFSAKSGVGNTIKFQDVRSVLKTIEDEDSIKDEYVDEYKVMDAIINNNAIQGPIHAAYEIGVLGVTKEMVDHWENIGKKGERKDFDKEWEFSEEIYGEFVKLYSQAMGETLKRRNKKLIKKRKEQGLDIPEFTEDPLKPTYYMINRQIEKILEEMSKDGRLEFAEFFRYVAEKVNYVMLNKFNKGIPVFSVIDPIEKGFKRKVAIKGKSETLKVGERMGIEPPKK